MAERTIRSGIGSYLSVDGLQKHGMLGDVVEECIERSGEGLSDKNRDFIVNFYRNVFDGLMMDWFGEGMEEEPEVLLEKLLLMISGSIPRSIAAFQEYEARSH